MTQAEQDKLADALGILFDQERDAVQKALFDRDRRITALENKLAELQKQPKMIGFEE